MIPSLRLVLLAGLCVFWTPLLYVMPDRWWIFLAADGACALLYFIDARRLPAVCPLEGERTAPETARQGKAVTVTLRLANAGTRKRTVSVHEHFPPAFTGSPGKAVMTIPPGDEVRWEFTLLPVVRGVVPSPPIVVRVLGPWGFAWRQYRLPTARSVTVYPLLPETAQARELSVRQHAFKAGEHLRKLKGTSSEFYAVREYNPGDDPRLLHWKASARRHRPMCRENMVAQQIQLGVLLDAGRPMAGKIGPYGKFDYALASVLALSDTAAALGDHLHGIVFSKEIKAAFHHDGRLGRGDFLNRLNALQPDADESEYAQAVETYMKTCKRRSLVLLITSVTDITWGRFISKFLVQLVPRHLPVLVNLLDSDLHRIARSIPETEREAWMKFSAMRIVAETRVMNSRLRASGVHVVNAPAEGLIFASVAAYLDLKKLA